LSGSSSSPEAAATAGTPGDPVTAFLAWLHVEKNFSPATVRAYAADLDQFARFCAGEAPGDARAAKPPRPPLDPAKITLRTVRGFLAALSGQGLKTSSLGRKLATLRSFFGS